MTPHRDAEHPAAHEHTPLNPSIHVQHDGDELGSYTNRDSIRPPKKPGKSQPVMPVLIKTQQTFWKDLKDFAPGTIPHSMIVALVVGIVCGVAAFVYYAGLEWLLDFLWHTLPEKYVIDKWPQHLYVLWIPIIGFSMALCVGLTVRFMGEPGTFYLVWLLEVHTSRKPLSDIVLSWLLQEIFLIRLLVYMKRPLSP